jgi:hypothetical protein
MTGQHITQRQVARYMSARAAGTNQNVASDQAGMSVRSARALDHLGRPVQGPRTYRTRIDAFLGVWEKVVEPELRKSPPLQAKTLFAELQRRYPGQFADSTRRSFERRVRSWRALHGPDRPIFFPQEHPPGWQGIMDFTVCNELSVTIGNNPFPHRLAHFRLSCSGWSYAHVILGGESFPALAETLRLALEALGGVPQSLRTDSLSAAFKNLKQMDDLTRRFQALCMHYGCTPTRNNRGEAHENGSIESPNGHLKNHIDQALILRGSRDFTDHTMYRDFVDVQIAARNRHCAVATAAEQLQLKPLPSHPGVTWSEETGVVSSYSMIRVLKVSYMVPTRLNGHRLTVRIYDDRLEFYDIRQQVFQCARVHAPGQSRLVNYHLIIGSLIAKPGAFARLVYRDDLHPSPVFARTWITLRDQLSEKIACRTYVRLLHLAHQHVCERALAVRLEHGLAAGVLPDIEALRSEFCAPRIATIPVIPMPIPNLTSYDSLLALSLAPVMSPGIPA